MTKHPHQDEFAALQMLATAPPNPKLSDALGQAKAAGASFVSILAILMQHAGDIQAIIAAILALAAQLKTATP